VWALILVNGWKARILDKMRTENSVLVDLVIDSTGTLANHFNAFAHLYNLSASSQHAPQQRPQHNLGGAEAPARALKIEVKFEAEIAQAADEVHIVFSTDCTGFQDWQALLLSTPPRPSARKAESRASRVAAQRRRRSSPGHCTAPYTLHTDCTSRPTTTSPGA